jgi:hypothetical protein
LDNSPIAYRFCPLNAIPSKRKFCKIFLFWKYSLVTFS